MSMLFVCTELPGKYAEKMLRICYDGQGEWLYKGSHLQRKFVLLRAHFCLCFDYFLLITLQYRWCLFCPEWQEEKMPLKTEVVSAPTVNEGNEAGRKMWGQGEISGTKVVRYVSCWGNRWTHSLSGQGWRKKTNEDYETIQIYTSWCQPTMSLHIFIAWAQAV